MNKTTPVAIVDKNGRATTVHRRDATKSSTGTNLLSPKAIPQSAAQGTPLEPIKPATAKQLRELIEAFIAEVNWPVADSLATEVSRKDQALIRRLLDNPGISSTLVKGIVQYGVKFENLHEGELTNSLLVVEQIASNGDIHLLEGPSVLFEAMLGVYQEGTRPYLDRPTPITTMEELASKAAVTTFILLADKNYRDDDSILKRRDKQFDFKWKRAYLVIVNKHLKKLVMERPERQHEITDYVRSRSMHPTNKKPVDALRAYLDEAANTTALGGGWL